MQGQYQDQDQPGKAVAPRGGAAATDGIGPDPGPAHETRAGFWQSAVYGDGGWFSLLQLE